MNKTHLTEEEKNEILDNFFLNNQKKYNIFSYLPWHKIKDKNLISRINGLVFGFVIFLFGFVFFRYNPGINNSYLGSNISILFNAFPYFLSLILTPLSFIAPIIGFVVAPIFPMIYFFIFKLNRKSIIIYFSLNIAVIIFYVLITIIIASSFGW